MIEAYKGFNYIWAYIKLSFQLFRFRFAALLSNAIFSAQTSSDFDERASINVQAERLLKEYGNSILRLAYSYVHNMSDVEDILQDTLIQYIKACPEFEASVNEKAWLMRVAGNLSKNRIKYNSIRTADELSEQLQSDEAEDLSFVWDAVKELPTKYSEVIHLYYYEGYSTAQIAEILSKNEQTVRSLLQRGRSRLKTVLKEVYDFE